MSSFLVLLDLSSCIPFPVPSRYWILVLPPLIGLLCSCYSWIISAILTIRTGAQHHSIDFGHHSRRLQTLGRCGNIWWRWRYLARTIEFWCLAPCNQIRMPYALAELPVPGPLLPSVRIPCTFLTYPVLHWLLSGRPLGRQLSICLLPPLLSINCRYR